ncbi:uncharacterized protein LOC110701830 [Chenopodium quinoa]|uniref:uncharacterized protein LOC110701830 n=1 Tax=Chenopodium quinoa TaxID=63459 RepID=UPI000B795BDA|nr:uncharacterized protein LOC110701830 [Chenopodium quinoa]
MGKDDNTSTSSSDYHPALGVNNIKNVFPFILDRDKVQYLNWVELFECHAHAYNVFDHIDSKTPKPTDLSDEMWKRLDSMDISSYCRELKNLKDQLANVDQPVSEQKLVIRLVSGLVNTDFDIVVVMIQQTSPLHSFETARSRLLLEESRRANDSSFQASSFVAQTSNTASSTAPQQQPATPTGQGGSSSGWGRGRGRGKGRGRGTPQQQQQQYQLQQDAPQWGAPPQ